MVEIILQVLLANVAFGQGECLIDPTKSVIRAPPYAVHHAIVSRTACRPLKDGWVVQDHYIATLYQLDGLVSGL